jgi:hypothetical protein
MLGEVETHLQQLSGGGARGDAPARSDPADEPNERIRRALQDETTAIADVLGQLAEGDLTVDIPDDSEDDDIARVNAYYLFFLRR